MKRIARLFGILLLLALYGCTGGDRYVAMKGFAQGGTWTVKANLRGVRLSPQAVRDSIDAILVEIDTTLSGYNKGSVLSRRNAGDTSINNLMFRQMCAIADSLREHTAGALDCAAGALFDAWGFGFKTDSLPSAEEVAALKGDRSRWNFNAIAQGYSCDRVAAFLYSLGVKDMLVDIGEIFCDGVNPSGQGWNIGVDRPEDGNQERGKAMTAVWQSAGGPCGIVTSGNYRKFYIRDGRKYAHTVDPRTGWPVQHNLLSATIVAPDALTADAWATYCMVVGVDQARDFILSDPSVEGYLVFDDGEGMRDWASPGFTLVSTFLQ